MSVPTLIGGPLAPPLRIVADVEPEAHDEYVVTLDVLDVVLHQLVMSMARRDVRVMLSAVAIRLGRPGARGDMDTVYTAVRDDLADSGVGSIRLEPAEALQLARHLRALAETGPDRCDLPLKPDGGPCDGLAGTCVRHGDVEVDR